MRVSVDKERSAREMEESPTAVESEVRDRMLLAAFLCHFGLEKVDEAPESPRVWPLVCTSRMLEK